jgi:hypothetical protein
MPAGNVVVQRTAFAQRHARKSAFRRISGLADRLRHFTGLTMAEADATLLIADHNERGKAEPPAAFHYLGDAVDVHELVNELAIALFGSSIAGFTRHDETPFLFKPLP